ncbi:MAG: type II toxin-antitoxin system VapC family toxin [Deltaproteobacteria bacterium]|nr:type II toxin-antitoxin system VapC family toxin [Deltaproteobacteria bacterium]
MEENRVILDTSAYSAFVRGNDAVRLSLAAADEINLNPVIIGELLAGFGSGTNEKKNKEILSAFLISSRVRVIEINEDTSERYAVIFRSLKKKGTPVPSNDLWIAASAMQHGLKVVTTDNHFLKIDLVLTEFCG